MTERRGLNESGSGQEQRQAGFWIYGNEHSGGRNAANFLTGLEIISSQGRRCFME
jgi:hypothetical protein